MGYEAGLLHHTEGCFMAHKHGLNTEPPGMVVRNAHSVRFCILFVARNELNPEGSQPLAGGKRSLEAAEDNPTPEGSKHGARNGELPPRFDPSGVGETS